MKKIITLILLVVSFSVSKSNCQTTDDGFEKFWNVFSVALENRDIETIADHTNFPFFSPDFLALLPASKRDDGITRDAFIQYGKKFFTKEVIEFALLAGHTKTILYGEESLCYWVAYSRKNKTEAWLTFCKNIETGEWNLVNTDNVTLD